MKQSLSSSHIFMWLFISLILTLSLLCHTTPLFGDTNIEKFITVESTRGAKINVYFHESDSDQIKEEPVLLVHGFNSDGKIWHNKENNYVKKLTGNGYDVIVVDMRGNAVDTDGDHKTDAPVVGDSWRYGVRDLGDDVGTALMQGLNYLNKNLPGRNYKRANVITHSTGALAVTSYSRSHGLVPYRDNIDAIIELAPPNNGSTSLIANIKQVGQIIPSVFAQGMVVYEYGLELLGSKVWIPGGRMESENLRKELIPESLFLKSIEGLGPDPRIKTFIAIGDEDWVVGNWSPAIEERDDIGYEYFVGLDHFGFYNSELVITALLDRLENGTESKFFNRFKPYRNKNVIAFLSGPGIDHPDDTFDAVTFAKDIDISPRALFDLYLRIAGRKEKIYLLKYWEGIILFEKAQKEIGDSGHEGSTIDEWQDMLSDENKIFHDYYINASKDYLECPDIAILANGYYNELTKLIIEKVGEPIRLVDHTFNPSILNEQRVLLIPSGGLSGISHSPIFRKKLSEYVKNGGTLICLSQQNGYAFSALPTASIKGYGWQEDASCHSKAAYIEDFHQILSSQRDLYPDIKLDGYFTAYPDDAKILLRRTKNLMPAVLIYKFGDGVVIAASIYSDWGYSNGQASLAEINLIRDLLRWSKGSSELPEYKIGKDFRETINVHKDFSSMEMILKSPDSSVIERKGSAGSSYELGVALDKPGIYCVDYILYNSNFEMIQPQTEGFYFCFSVPPEGSINNPNFTFDITTDGENYTSGAEVKFSFHIKNNTDQDELIKCKARLPHHEIEFTESVQVQANSLVSFDKTIIATKTDLLTANFYSSGNNFLGRAERGITVFEPSVEVNTNTDKMQYTPGQKISISSSVINTSKASLHLLLVLNIIDSKNNEVYYNAKTLELTEEKSYSWNQDFTIPGDATRGIYKIKLNAFSNSKLVGASSVNVDIPGPLLYVTDGLPPSFSELLEIVMGRPVYETAEPISAKIIINNKGKKIDTALLDIRVLPNVEIGDLWGMVRDEKGAPIRGALVNAIYTNSKGEYRIGKVGKGKSILNVKAPGYNRVSREIDILAGDNNLDVTLSAAKYGNLSGALEGTIGSELTLEPIDVAGSDASTRKAVVSTEDIFEFKHVPVGDYRVNVQPEDITRIIQIKEGENTAVFEARPQIGLSEVRPRSQTIRQDKHETEPNDGLDTATEISSGTGMRGKIYDYGDEDYFRLTVDSASILKIQLSNVAQGFSPHIKIYNSEKRWFDSTAAFSGEEIEYSLEISEPGVYYLQLKDRYNSFSSQEEYLLSVTLVQGTDIFEPNSDFKTAKDIDIRKEIVSTMFPKGDEDYFSINIEAQGIFYIKIQNVPEGLRPSLKIYDSSGKLISQKAGSSGEKIALEAEIGESGRYYLLVKDWYSSFSSAEPYSFKTYFIETLDEYEPNNVKDEATLVNFGTNYFATISTKGDSDFYKLSVPDSGKIIVYLKDAPSNIRPYLKLYKDSRKSWIDSVAGFAGSDLLFEFETDSPSNYFIQIQDRYNSESSLLKYRLLATYIPDNDYLSEDPSIFKETLEISDIIHTKEIDIEIPGIEQTGKYYLQAALKSSIPEKNSQAVERFYVSNTGAPVEPAPSPEIKVSYLETEGAIFDAGRKARFRFKATNSGSAGGQCQIDFKFMDLFSHSLSEFLEPGTERDLEFEFLLPIDLEEGLYEAEYAVNGKKDIINFRILGLKLEVETEFKNNIFRINVKNIGSIRNVDLFAEVRCGSFEDKRDFRLMDIEELIFKISEANGQKKIYYGIYFSSGKALYLNSFLLDEEEDIPEVLIKVIEAQADKDSYENEDTIFLTWKVNSQDKSSIGLIVELIRPDFMNNRVIDEEIDLDRGVNILSREINPELIVPGLYRILYKFTYEGSVIVQGSIFFDVGEEIRIDLHLDKREYMQNEPAKVKVYCFSSFALKGNLTLFIDKEAVKTRNINLDGYREFDFSIKISEIGRHRVYSSLFYDNERVDSDEESFSILPLPKTNHSPVLFTIGEKRIVAGEILEFFVEAMDIDGDELFYSVDGLPVGASFDSDARRFSWRPDYKQFGEYFVTFVVGDGEDSAFERVRIVVTRAAPLPPNVRGLAVPLNGMAPLEVNFSADSVDDDGVIVKYEWDFDGKGIYDFSSLESGDVIFVYMGKGSFPVTLRVTDNEGYTNTHTTIINVERNPDAPQVYLEATPLKGLAPCKVYFQGSVNSTADISKYEWDFDGDGVFNTYSSESGEVVKTYGVPGTYKAEFKVTSSEGLSDSETVLLEILDPLVLNAEPVISDDTGNVPVEVDFDAFIDAENAMQKYQWDFEGDGIFDFTSTDSAAVNHVYYKPGVYTPILRIIDEKNIAIETKKEVRFGISDIANIKSGKMIVSHRKGEAPFTVQFSLDSDFKMGEANYLWDFDGDGVCDIVTYLPEAEFTYYDSGVYIAEVNIRVADNFISSYRETIYVTNGKRNSRTPASVDKSELKKNVFKNRLDRIELSDRTFLILPAGILSTDDVVNIKKLEEDEIYKKINLGENIAHAGEYREYKFENHKGTFNKEMLMSIPYVDEDDDGIVDERNIYELTLDAYWYDEEAEEWKILSDALVFPRENIVTIKTNHFSIFGIAGTEGGSEDAPLPESPDGAGGGGGGGGNGNTGGSSSCFIATAAFGTPMAEEVRVLCEFRDRHLLRSEIGRTFVNFYYKFSLPIANFISKNQICKMFLRACLRFFLPFIEYIMSD